LQLWRRAKLDYWREYAICVIPLLDRGGRFVEELRMTDKRTPPDAASGAQRRKRAAPTIDLTATEVPPLSSAGDAAPERPGVQEPPAAEPERPPAAAAKDNWWIWVGANTGAPALTAGAAGATLMSLVLLGLWLTGLVPVRYAEPATPSARIAALEKEVHILQDRSASVLETKSISTLGERLAKIESALANFPAGDAGAADRLTTADNAMKSFGVALAALNRRSDDIAGNVLAARDRAEAAEKAVMELRASVQDVSKNTGVSSGDLDALQNRIAAAADTPARLALSAAALRDAAMSGAPFPAELAQVISLGVAANALVALEPYVATGVPPQAVLAQELRFLMPAMLKISSAQTPTGGFLERLQANAGNLVRIRPVDAPPSDDASALLARVEIDAARADIVAALADLAKLSEETRAPAQNWIGKAQARQTALAAARQLAADTAGALGPKAAAR